MGTELKSTSKELRKKVWEYTKANEQFTSLELNNHLGFKSSEITSKRNVVTSFLQEMVSWSYLTTIKEGKSYRYYVND